MAMIVGAGRDLVICPECGKPVNKRGLTYHSKGDVCREHRPVSLAEDFMAVMKVPMEYRKKAEPWILAKINPWNYNLRLLAKKWAVGMMGGENVPQKPVAVTEVETELKRKGFLT